ncbi:unnamed protein product [Soboliphyme baturini]|uniref:Transmembrane protein n=1 Tax=Soboliphyme baturini TaxID=241478 RepID=A0A183IBV7_9BILA|nr:unnamed protein product [Soboliphyme baturini]
MLLLASAVGTPDFLALGPIVSMDNLLLFSLLLEIFRTFLPRASQTYRVLHFIVTGLGTAKYTTFSHCDEHNSMKVRTPNMPFMQIWITGLKVVSSCKREMVYRYLTILPYRSTNVREKKPMTNFACILTLVIIFQVKLTLVQVLSFFVFQNRSWGIGLYDFYSMIFSKYFLRISYIFPLLLICTSACRR